MYNVYTHMSKSVHVRELLSIGTAELYIQYSIFKVQTVLKLKENVFIFIDLLATRKNVQNCN